MGLGILVIDNHAPSLKAVKLAVSGLDVHVRIAEDGTRGLTEAEKERPAAILLGLELPPKNYGYVVCQRLKKSASTQTVPIVLLYSTASDADIKRHMALKHRAEAYLKRPISPTELVDTLDRLLGSLPRVKVGATERAAGDSGNGPVSTKPGHGLAVDEIALSDDDLLFDDEPDVPAVAVVPPSGAKSAPDRSPRTIELDRLNHAADVLRNELEETRVQAGNDLDTVREECARLASKVGELESAAAHQREWAKTEEEVARRNGDLARGQIKAFEERIGSLESELLAANAKLTRAADEMRAADARHSALVADGTARIEALTQTVAERDAALDRALQIRERMKQAVKILEGLTSD